MTSPQFLACLFLIANILFLVDASLLLEEQCRTCQCRCEEKCQRESNSYETDDKYESNDRNDLQDEMNAIQANIGPEYEPNDLQDNINTIQANTGTEYEPEPFLNPIPVANSRVPQSCERCARQNFDIMNEYRRSHGLRPIRWSQGLGRSAAEHSKEMYRHLSLYHSNHRGWENVAESMGRSTWQAIAQSMFEQWRRSPPHRRNMLSNQITCGGVGVYGDGERFYGTQMLLGRC